MIGLKRGTVKIVQYDPRWKELFETEQKRLRKLLSKEFVDIQHIGSTAVPGLSAKPVIDIAVGVMSMGNAKKYIHEIEKIGYVWRSKFGRIDRHIVFAKGNGVTNTNYLHLVKYRGKIWEDRIAFRDYLIQHATARKQYEKLKYKLAAKFSDDRESYTGQKEMFVKEILNRTTVRKTKKPKQ